jgi:hypothetical protein
MATQRYRSFRSRVARKKNDRVLAVRVDKKDAKHALTAELQPPELGRKERNIGLRQYAARASRRTFKTSFIDVLSVAFCGKPTGDTSPSSPAPNAGARIYRNQNGNGL